MKTAVINDVHSVSVKIYAKMLEDVGFAIRCTGPSFRGVVPLYHTDHRRHPPSCKGPVELAAMPQDALYVDTHPEAVTSLRARGWRGPILLMWIMPVGPEWVRQHLRVDGKVGSLAFSRAVGKEIAKMNVCPNDNFWPPYVGDLDQHQRNAHGDYLVTVVENAAGWSNVPVLEQLRDHPKAKLELYGGGPPAWSRKVPHPELMARLRGSSAMYHLKPFDTPGFAVMEAALQGVPIIFPPDWIRATEEEMFEHDKSCLIVPTEVPRVLEAVDLLKDWKDNSRLGGEGRRRMLIASDWPTNRVRFDRLIAAVYGM